MPFYRSALQQIIDQCVRSEWILQISPFYPMFSDKDKKSPERFPVSGIRFGSYKCNLPVSAVHETFLQQFRPADFPVLLSFVCFHNSLILFILVPLRLCRVFLCAKFIRLEHRYIRFIPDSVCRYFRYIAASIVRTRLRCRFPGFCG